MAAQHAAILKADAVLKALQALVKTQLGSTEAVLGDFGFTTGTRKKPDETTKAEAVLKRAATRTARHTMGKRQKAKVKGQPQPAPATPPMPTKPT